MKRAHRLPRRKFEALEPRHLMAVSAEFTDGTLLIHGDSEPNRIQVTATATGALTVLVNDSPQEIVATSTRLQPLDARQVQRIEVWGHDGGDRIDLRVAPHTFVNLSGTQIYSGSPQVKVGSQPLTVWGAFARNNIVGSAGDDRLIGGAGDDNIIGYGGRDEIDGLGGADHLHGGIPFLDYLFPKYADQGDIIRGGDGSDLIFGGPGDDILDGGPGRDTIKGEQGHDIIRGGLHADTIEGGSENDQIFGDFRDADDDGFFPFGGADQIYGGQGADLIRGGPGNDQIWGDQDNDILHGDAGCDVLDGGDGFANVLRGGTGDDILTHALMPHSQGGSGVDRVNGQLEDPPGTPSEGCAFGIEVDLMPLNHATSEWGGSASLNVRLLSPPAADVVIAGIHSNDTSEGKVFNPFPEKPVTLTFTPKNWHVFQRVSVIGQADHVDDGDVKYAIMLPATVSDDPHYNNLTWDFQEHDYVYSMAHAMPNHSAICLTNLDHDPQAVDDHATTLKNRSVRIDVLANDLDLDSKNTLVIDRWSQPVDAFNPNAVRGTVRSVGNQLEYTPPQDFTGKIEFHYKVRGNVTEATDQATVTIDVHDGGQGEIFNRHTFWTPQDTPLLIPPHDIVTRAAESTIVSQPAIIISPTMHGDLTQRPDGSWLYVPQESFLGTDSFRYQIDDGSHGLVEVEIQVVPISPTESHDQPLLSATRETEPLSPSGLPEEPLASVLGMAPRHSSINLDGGTSQTPFILPTQPTPTNRGGEPEPDLRASGSLLTATTGILTALPRSAKPTLPRTAPSAHGTMPPSLQDSPEITRHRWNTLATVGKDHVADLPVARLAFVRPRRHVADFFHTSLATYEDRTETQQHAEAGEGVGEFWAKLVDGVFERMA